MVLETGELFDPETHRMIDISHTVEPGENPDRPFAIQRGYLPDDTYKYDVLETHTHVGTHVEGGAHFYGPEAADTIEETPLERFYGPGVLFPVTEREITPAVCEDALGDRLREGDFVVARNDTETRLSKEEVYAEDAPPAPAFTPEAGEWLADRGATGVVLGELRLGRSIEASDAFHDALMGEGAVFVEIVDNLHAIERDRFTLLALPYKARRLGSSFCRAVVIERRDA